MPGWYYEKKELRKTPSTADGIDHKTEMRYRKEGARFIIDTGMKMDLGFNTTATGVVYFHRFYMFHSFKQFPRYVIACCCLFLAGKVEETPKKCKDIIKQAKALLTDQKFLSFGDDPKEEVMTLERILLQTIKFDLQVEHPYSFLITYAKSLKGEKAKLEKMVQMAWTFVNDSLCTTLCLQWEPEIIAVALMYLAGKLSKFEVVDWVGRVPKHLRWWDMFVEDITMDLLEDICHQVLDLYSHDTKPKSESPPPIISHSTPTSPVAPPPLFRPSSPDQPPPVNTRMPPPFDVPQYLYQTFTAAPPPLDAYAPVYSTPVSMSGHPPGAPPHIGAPPPSMFAPYVGLPPPFPPGVQSGGPPTTYYSMTSAPPPSQHRPYYPPT